MCLLDVATPPQVSLQYELSLHYAKQTVAVPKCQRLPLHKSHSSCTGAQSVPADEFLKVNVVIDDRRRSALSIYPARQLP